MPPETAVVPPTVAAFSYTATEAPLTAAVSADGQPGAAAAEHDDVDLVVPIGHVLNPFGAGDPQDRIADSSLAALMTASLPCITTSSRCEMRLMHVGGDGGCLRTGTARP